MEIAPADPGDLPDLRALVRSSGLRDEDMGLPGQRFLLAREAGRLVGCIGLEVHGAEGLLRSFAVEPGSRGRGVGRALHQRAVALARELGVRELFILTTTVRDMALAWGFEEVGRDAVPEAIRQGEQFRSLCPASAPCLRLRVP
ncbi:MAG TPA: GNAT family N-acetyltransferase [Anaeromyxobacteraceae bacterium]|nr:GNAT family N-acetyltransferase [Anaeromyxobacteraceae bacterium]